MKFLPKRRIATIPKRLPSNGNKITKASHFHLRMDACAFPLGKTAEQAITSGSALLNKRKPMSELGTADIDENYLGMPVKKYSEPT